MTRKLASLILALLIGVVFIGSALASEDVTLNFITWRGDDKAANDEIVARFNEEYPNIHINFEYDTGGDAHHQLLKVRLLAGEVDMYALNPGEQNEYINAGYVYELTGQPFLDNYIDSALSCWTYGDKVYGASQATAVVVVFYNVDMFAAHGISVPKTYNEFIAVCDAFLDKGVKPIALGASMQYIPQNIATPLLCSLAPDTINDLIPQVLSDPSLLSGEPFKTVNDNLKLLYDKGYFVDGYTGIDKFGAAALLVQGEAPMFIEGTWRSSTLTAAEDLNWDMFLLSAPGGAENTYVNHANQGHVIASSTKKLDACLKFYEFFSRPEMMTLYSSKTNQIPVGKGVVVDSPAIAKALALIDGKVGVLDPIYSSTSIEYTNNLYQMWHRIVSGEPIDAVVAEVAAQIAAIE